MWITAYAFGPTNATGKGGKVTFGLMPDAEIRDTKSVGMPSYDSSQFANRYDATTIDQGGRQIALFGYHHDTLVTMLTTNATYVDLTVEEDAKEAAEKARTAAEHEAWKAARDAAAAEKAAMVQ
jgi:hypothetical protein